MHGLICLLRMTTSCKPRGYCALCATRGSRAWIFCHQPCTRRPAFSSVWKVSNYWRINCTSVKISIRTHTHTHTHTRALAILDRHLANNHKSHAKPSDHPTLSLCTEESMLHLSIFIFCVTDMTKKSMPCGNLCELKVLDILVRQAIRGSTKQWWIPHAKQ